MPNPEDRCPCLSGDPYGSCCARFHSGALTAPTAEALMRSRYSAFAIGDQDYVLATWAAAYRPAALHLDPHLRWRRLDILRTERGGPLDSEGTVEFRAHYLMDGVRRSQHETSRFRRLDGRWYYLDGTTE